jgi:hypothetical protein
MRTDWQTIASTKRPDIVGSDTTQRLKIERGWLYRTVILEEASPDRLETSVAICFVPE